MEDFYNLWRRRFAVHAALLLVLSIAVGLVHFATLDWDEKPCPRARSLCVPDPSEPLGIKPGTCLPDKPCIPDTLLEHRWRMAHQQGLAHALLLFGLAIGVAYFRIGRSFIRFAGWLVIVGAWATLIGAIIQAATTFYPHPGWQHDLFVLLNDARHPAPSSTPSEWQRLVLDLFSVGGPAAGIALALVGALSVWEIVRDGIAPSTWKNWAHIVWARPRRIEEPQDLEDLLKAVQTAMDKRMHVRAFGSRYSWSAIAPTDDTMIDMRKLRNIEAPIDPVPNDSRRAQRTVKTIRVEAGATIYELTKKLKALGLMLETSMVNPWVQVGGALALGCHGTGVHHPPFSDLVTEIEIVQYNTVAGVKTAVLNTYRRPLAAPNAGNQADWNRWNSLIVNLGCLGVMYRIQFECAQLFDVHIVDTGMDMEATLNDDAALRQILNHQYAEIFWVPYNKKCWIRSWDPVATPAAGFSFFFWVRQAFVARVLGPAFLLLLALIPWATRGFMWVLGKGLVEFDHRVPAPDAMQYQRFFMRVYDMGYAIPYSPDPLSPIGFDRMRKAWFAVVDRLKALHHQAIYPQNLVLHARFGTNGTALLAPSSGQPFSCYIEIVTHMNTARHEEYYRAVERDWLRLEGRPHWGKVAYARDRIRDAYPAATVATFLGVRRLMDPDQVFLNDYLREVLRVEEP